MAAGSPAIGLPEPAPQQAEVRRAAFGYPLELPGDGVKSEDARAALARRLIREVAHYPGGLSKAAGALGQGRDQAGAGACAEWRQAGRGERQCCRGGRADPGAEVAAEQQRVALCGCWSSRTRCGWRACSSGRSRRKDRDEPSAAYTTSVGSAARRLATRRPAGTPGARGQSL